MKSMKKFLRKAAKPITFITANGKTRATEMIGLFIKEFGTQVSPYVLDSTPALLSVGFRCMELGYTFVWPPGQDPYFILPDENVVYLEVIDNIPYLRPGAKKCQPRSPQGGACYACG